MEEKNKPKRKKRYIVLGILTGLLAAIVIFTYATPLPASWLLRAAFKYPPVVKPEGYAQMEKSVRVIKDAVYPSEYKKNTADIYLPIESDTLFPVILWAHGGAYVGGDKTDVTYYATALASQGYAVIAMNYALAPEEKYPAQLLQVTEAYNYIDSIKEECSLDMAKLVLAGDSAGASLMAQFALVQTVPEYAKKYGFKASAATESLRGLLLYCGPYDVARIADAGGLFGFFLNRSAWAYFGSNDWQNKFGNELSISEYVTESFPPCFITDGNTNSFLLHGEDLAETLKSKNVYVDTYFMSLEEERTSHEYQFDMSTESGKKCYAGTLKFLEKLM